MTLGVQALRSFEGQGPPNSGYYQSSIRPARPHSNHNRQTAQQGQQHGGFFNRHNLGQMRNRRPSQSTSLSFEENQSRKEFRFPTLQGRSHEEQSEGTYSDAPQVHGSRITSRDNSNEPYTTGISNIEDPSASSVAPWFTNDPRIQGVRLSTRGDTKSLTEHLDTSRNDGSNQPDDLLTKEQSVPNDHVVESVHPAERENNDGSTSLPTDLCLHLREPSGEQSSNSSNIPSRSSPLTTSTSLKDGKDLKSLLYLVHPKPQPHSKQKRFSWDEESDFSFPN